MPVLSRRKRWGAGAGNLWDKKHDLTVGFDRKLGEHPETQEHAGKKK